MAHCSFRQNWCCFWKRLTFYLFYQQFSINAFLHFCIFSDDEFINQTSETQLSRLFTQFDLFFSRFMYIMYYINKHYRFGSRHTERHIYVYLYSMYVHMSKSVKDTFCLYFSVRMSRVLIEGEQGK